MPVLEYMVDQDYIAEVLCINKEKKELNCKGKCYLMQQLKAQEDNSTPNFPKISLEKYPIGFVSIASIPLEKKQCFNSKKRRQYYQNSYSFLFQKNSFHPPTIS